MSYLNIIITFLLSFSFISHYMVAILFFFFLKITFIFSLPWCHLVRWYVIFSYTQHKCLWPALLSLTPQVCSIRNCSFYTFGEGAVKWRVKFETKKKKEKAFDWKKYTDIHVTSFLKVCLYEREVSYQD